jgi:phosphate-selective porin OprO/OprP
LRRVSSSSRSPKARAHSRASACGIAGTSGKHSGTVAAPGLATYRTTASFFGYRSDGTTAGTTIAAGDRRRLSPQASYFRGPFGVLAEYAESKTAVRRAASRANAAQQRVAARLVVGVRRREPPSTA